MSNLTSLPFAQLIFDGVILDCATLKTKAFASVYSDEPDDLVAKVTAYQETHGGVVVL